VYEWRAGFGLGVVQRDQAVQHVEQDAQRARKSVTRKAALRRQLEPVARELRVQREASRHRLHRDELRMDLGQRKLRRKTLSVRSAHGLGGWSYGKTDQASWNTTKRAKSFVSTTTSWARSRLAARAPQRERIFTCLLDLFRVWRITLVTDASHEFAQPAVRRIVVETRMPSETQTKAR